MPLFDAHGLGFLDVLTSCLFHFFEVLASFDIVSFDVLPWPNYHGFLLVALCLTIYAWSCYPWMDHSRFHSSTFVVLPFFDIATLSSIVIFNPSLSLAFHCLWTLSLSTGAYMDLPDLAIVTPFS